jgi:hypothetical protein
MSLTAGANSVKKSQLAGDGEIPDLSQAVAAALGLADGQVVVGNEKCVWDERSIKFTGHADGDEFFAKLLMVDPYPVNLAVPWQRALVTSAQARSATEQVKREASARSELSRLMNVSAIPRCIGSSAQLRTIVWERVSGTSVLGLLRRSRLFDPQGKTCRSIAFEAGEWLRQLHDSTRRGVQELKVCESLNAVLRAILAKRNSASAKHAIELVRSCAERAGASLLTPVGRNHGDFTLVNLIWNQPARQLRVIDFENSEYGATWQDLASITFSLQKQLLNPLVPVQTVRGMEHSFWRGYGEIAPELFSFIQALAASKILVDCPERLGKSGEGRMWTREIAGSLYASFVQTKLMPRAVPGFSN